MASNTKQMIEQLREAEAHGMTPQNLIQWARQDRPDDPRLIEAGTEEETEASLRYIYDVLLHEGEQG